MAEAHEKIYKSRKRIFLDNFTGGIAWGLGASVGLSVLLAVTGFIVSNIDWVPIVGSIISEAYNQVLQSNPELLQ